MAPASSTSSLATSRSDDRRVFSLVRVDVFALRCLGARAVDGAVLVGFVVIGAALPVLPLFVQNGLGFGPAMVGVVAGCQFIAALIARIWAGQSADIKGAKWAVMAGLAGAVLAGLLYLCAFGLLRQPRVSIAALLAGVPCWAARRASS